MHRRNWKLGVVTALGVAVLALMLAAATAFGSTARTISADKADYAPGETVTLTGAGWEAGEAVVVSTTASDGSWRDDGYMTADDAGTFTHAFPLPAWYVSDYTVTAVGALSGTATTTFTDLSIDKYDQCSNDTGTGYPSGDTGCRWINGNLQPNNSLYREGDSTVQRLSLTSLVPGSHHNITFQYGTTKGGKHAYDFLTTWNYSEDWITDADRCQGIAGCTSAASESTLAIPADAKAQGFDLAAGSRQFVMRGGSMTAATTPSIVSGSYAGDSETQITISFDVGPSSGAMCSTKSGVTTCGIAIWFGAHVALTSEWKAFDGTTGAGTISGSPYHVALAALDGSSIGSRDNQMQSNTVVANGTIVIVKDAVPNDPQDFGFNVTNGSTVNEGFLLDDDADATLPNRQTLSLPPGSYTAQEFGVPAGWNLTGLVCSVTGTNGSSSVVSLATASATITLKSNDTVTCTYTNTKGYDLTVSKTAIATFTRDYTWDIAKSVDKTEIDIASGGSATFNYQVAVNHTAHDSGWTVAGSITVTNPNGYAITGVNVTDAIDNGGTCTVTGGTNVTVGASASVSVPYSCTFATAPASGTNTATATWDAGAFHTPDGTASGTAAYDFSTVTPTVTHGTITIVDDKTDPAHPVTLGTATYAQANPIAFTYTLNKSGVAGTCTSYTNVATIQETKQTAGTTVKVCVGKDLTVAKTAAGTFDRTYLWNIAKKVKTPQINIADGGTATFDYTVTVTQTGVSDSGWTLAGKITVTNPNDWEAITADVTDAVDNGGVCTVTGGTGVVIPASGSATLDYACTFASKPAYSGRNTATATWDKAAAYTPSGSASGSAAFTLSQSGSTNKTVNVTDSLAGALGSVTATDSMPFAAKDFTYSHGFSGVPGTCKTYDNTATIVETKQTDDATVQVCVGKDLTVSKTAAGTFNRQYLWKIAKDADKTLAKVASGGSATFNYTVTVEQTGFSDSGWTLAGKITIANPNDWEAITLTGLTDTVDNGGVCTVAAGPYVIPANGSIDVAYGCSYASAPSSYSGTNTATATWDKAAAFTPTGSASGSANFVLTQLGSTNKTVHVTDSFGGALGSVTATDSAPFAKGSFSYSRMESGVAGTCTDYTNTATITETGQTAGKVVTLCVGKDLTVTKTANATFDRLYKWLIDKDVDKTEIDIAAGGTATFNYDVTVTPNGYVDSGWVVTGGITVTNPNDWEAITADVTDSVDIGGGAACTISGGPTVSVPAGKSVTVSYSCTISGQPSYTGLNTAVATWDDAAFFTPSDSATGKADVLFKIVGETNKVITVVDDKTDPAHPVTLGTANWPDGARTFTYALDKQGVAGTCSSYTNVAKIVETGQKDDATVKVCAGTDLTVSKTAAGTFNRSYLWQIAKNVDKTLVKIAAGGTATFSYGIDVAQTGFTDSGWTLAGKITISNPNDWEAVTLTSLTDVVDNGGACTVAAGPYVVPASGSIDVAYTCTYASAPTSYSGSNTATATWDRTKAFTPTGSASASKAFTLTQAGSTNKTIHVTDSYAGALGTITATDAAPWASATFTYDRTESGVAGTCTNYPNTASITETGQSAAATVTVCVGKDLTISKTATPAFKRTYDWSISKAVDKTLVKQVGGSATFTYSVTVKETGFSDSNWVVTGKITISNPNDWEAVTLTGLTDAVDNGGTCTVDAGPYVVPKGASLAVNYSCTYATKPSSASGTNTATATWDKAAAFTPGGTVSGDRAFAFTSPTSTVNKVVTVTDSFNGSTTTLGTVTATDALPFASKTFTYPRTIAIPTYACKNYDNTAKIVETGQTASQRVTVCGPIHTGALTIGYWQNKNGQTIIGAGASVNGVCKSGTWLRQFAPFQDLSATASCYTVKTYVYNVVRAANASGASMNAMLKAQMLATALDVYFSDPALGGNKINAPTAIGGVTVDISKWSAAFGGATSMKISNMLVYAASKSNAGGSLWYANNKTIQGLAKSAFDAINNQKVLAP